MQYPASNDKNILLFMKNRNWIENINPADVKIIVCVSMPWPATIIHICLIWDKNLQIFILNTHFLPNDCNYILLNVVWLKQLFFCLLTVRVVWSCPHRKERSRCRIRWRVVWRWWVNRSDINPSVQRLSLDSDILSLSRPERIKIVWSVHVNLTKIW